MKLAIFTSVEHTYIDGKYYGYGPYVREMNIWNSFVDEVFVLAPLSKQSSILPMDVSYTHENLNFVQIPSFNISSFPALLKTLVKAPIICFTMYRLLRKVDHSHFRCPSNVGLLGCLVQILFPKLQKSTKYAGNWDPKSKQPATYQLQKRILSNTSLTKNMKVLVYGEWPNQTKNIVPFISATYRETEKTPMRSKDFSGELKFVFAGSIVVGKRPIFTAKIIEQLNEKGYKCSIDMFGEGDMMAELKSYVSEHHLEDRVRIHGNKPREVVKETLMKAHFTILPSKSEGWPKAVAEGMFFGAIPISTKISCLSWMLDKGRRGILIEPDLESAVYTISKTIEKEDLTHMALSAQKWSQQYTLEALDKAIKYTLLA